MARTSQSHPLQIAQVQASPAQGRIGITFCPGKQDPFALSGAWARDLTTDLAAITAWGARHLVTLVEPAELNELKVPQLGQAARQAGLSWYHLPIADYSVPSDEFERQWCDVGRTLRQALRHGEDVLVHCKGGLGRAGMIAARLLVELGLPPVTAIRAVRRARPGAIETPAQLALVRRTQPLTDEVPPLDSDSLTRVGGQLGSNPAGLYQDADGRRYYIKTLESLDHARNERLAARLYALAGAPTLPYVATRDPLQIATAWLALDKRRLSQFSDAERRQAQAWFGVHAWTANWDAAGLLGDNQGVWQGRVLTLDVGGALAFRAYGDPKGSAFGNEVNEIDRLRTDPDNPQAVRLFGDMDAAALRQAIERVLRIPAEEIRACVLACGGRERLADKLVARQADMARQLADGRLA